MIPTLGALRGVRGKESSLYSTSLTAVRVDRHVNNMNTANVNFDAIVHYFYYNVPC
jgi:hypothetical protein